MKKINIAIRGGGVKVPAVGVLKALKEEKVQIRCYSGTSIGAIIATLAALDTSCTEIEQLLKEFVVIYSNASRLKGGKGSQVIEDTVNGYCKNLRFKDLKVKLIITANQGGIWHPKKFVFSKETTPNVTLGEACRASCSFPIAYEHYHMRINEKNYKFWDGGMVANPILPQKGFNIVCSFKKEKTNLNSRYVDAWKKPEEHADFLIKPYIGNMGTFGTPEDIALASELGYTEAKRRMEELLQLIK